MNSRPVTFVWPGDMHLEFPDRPNYETALWMAEEVNSLVKPDFVQFAGDNVQHARDPEWELFKTVTGKLSMPWHAVVGDHDAHHDPGCHAFQANVGETYGAYTVGGYRFIRLNTMEFRPLGLTNEQVIWFRYEVDAALARGERVVVFQHHYPFKVFEHFAGPGIDEWRQVMQTRPVTALFTGHTHYGQMANDGRNVYIVTRSIGDPEGGAPGYSVVYLDGDDIAVKYRTREDRGPIAMITHPRRLILATTPEHIVTGPDECRVRAWSASGITSAQARIDDGHWNHLQVTDELRWKFPIDGETLEKGEHTLEVRLIDQDQNEGTDRIVFACDLSGRYTAYPMVEPVVKGTKYC
jgi:3',5'-cyclic-AMP phosphodiesterase